MLVKFVGNFFILFDVGGIVGGVLVGYMFDVFKVRVIMVVSFMYVVIFVMFLYRVYGNMLKVINIMFMMMVGLFVNGLYVFIMIVVFVDFGIYSFLSGDFRVLVTVIVIIDGIGFIGVVFGFFLIGFFLMKGWDVVFVMLMVGVFIAGFF